MVVNQLSAFRDLGRLLVLLGCFWVDCLPSIRAAPAQKRASHSWPAVYVRVSTYSHTHVTAYPTLERESKTLVTLTDTEALLCQEPEESMQDGLYARGSMPAAGEAACLAEHREAVLLGQRSSEARRVRCVVVAEHRGLAGGSLSACRPGTS